MMQLITVKPIDLARYVILQILKAANLDDTTIIFIRVYKYMNI